MKLGILCQHRSGHSAYEQQLSVETGLQVVPEFDLNHRDLEEYIGNLPDSCIFSVMPCSDVGKTMALHDEIQWRILIREDFVTQCLSFVYTNKTQIFNGEQKVKANVDATLVDTFFKNYKIIRSVANLNRYKIYRYEDLDLSQAYWKKNSNQYRDLILNINEVFEKIDHYKNQLSLYSGTANRSMPSSNNLFVSSLEGLP